MPRSAGPLLLVDDDPALLRWLSRQLEFHGYRVSCARSADEVREQLAALPVAPRGAIVDILLGQESGFRVVGDLRRLDSPCASLVMTGHPDPAIYQRAVLFGVVDFVQKPIEFSEILRALPRVFEATSTWRRRKAALARHADGSALVDPSNEALRQSKPDEVDVRIKPNIERLVQDHTISRRQGQVLRFMILGLRNAEIAERLGITERTVKHHAATLLKALGVRSRAELMLRLL